MTLRRFCLTGPPALVTAILWLAVCCAPALARPQTAPGAQDGEAQTDMAAVTDWDREIGAILDLLIDDRFSEAEDRAAHLLEREDLPEHLASWIRELQAKAQERRGGVAAEPRQKIETGSGKEEPEQEPVVTDDSFPVRVALIGGGFAAGVSGRLSISRQGIAFTPKKKGGEAWSVPWRELAEARRDDGLWDVSYPILIAERKGRKHYVARIDDRGRYLSGDAILSAINRSRGTSK
ncbi:MAG TPA: hypothetical protein VF756_29935 [Thermoanaerobaculia bacterium]